MDKTITPLRFAQIAPWISACLCILTLWRFAPAAAQLPHEHTAYWGDGFYAREKGAHPYRWTSDRATLHILAWSIGAQRLTLTLQSGRSMPVPVQIAAQDRTITFNVEPVRRSYQVLVPSAFAPRLLDVTLLAPTFRPKGDGRNLGVIVAHADIDPLRGGFPWWLLTALLILAQTAALQFAVLRRLPGLLRSALLVVWIPALLLWLGADSYTYRAFAIVFAFLAATSLLYIAVALASYIGSLPAAREWRRAVEQYRHDVPAHLQIQVAAWDRAATRTALALAGLAGLVRIVLAPDMSRYWNGDDYLTGVFALNILHGDLPLYYGHHTGTLASYLIAPVLALTGASLPALMVLPMILTVILTIALYGLGRDLFGVCGGVAAASWMALPPVTVMVWSLKPQPGYLEAITFATLALWGTVRLLWGAHSWRAQVWLMAGIGLTGALAVWSGYVIAPFVLTCAVAGLLAWRRLRLPILGYALLIAIPALLWFVPLILYVLRFPRNNPIWWVLDVPRPALNPGAAFWSLIKDQLPLLLTGRSSMSSIPEYMLIAVVLLCVLYAVFKVIFYRSRADILVLTLILVTIGLYTVTSFGYILIGVDYTVPLIFVVSLLRYILPLIIAIPLLLSGLVAKVSQLYDGGRWPVLLLIGILVLNGSTLGDKVRHYITYAPGEEAVLTSSLQQQGIRFIHTSYWIAMPVMFESSGEIVAATLVGPNVESYDVRNEERVLAAQGVDTSFVFRKIGIGKPAFENYINQHHIVCDRRFVREFAVYSGCTPFPDIQSLTRVLPRTVNE